MQILTTIEIQIQDLLSNADAFVNLFTLVTRLVFPILSVIIFFRCFLPLMGGGRKTDPWAYLSLGKGEMLPLSHWENSIGRAPSCDVNINYPNISRVHAVLSRKNNRWIITDINSKGGIEINDKKVEGQARLRSGDIIKLAGSPIKIIQADDSLSLEDSNKISKLTKLWNLTSHIKPGVTLFFILLFQIIGTINIALLAGEDYNIIPTLTFIGLGVLQIGYFLYSRKIYRSHIEPELLAFYLSGMSLFICSSVGPISMLKQFIAIILGLIMFAILTFFLNNLDIARKARYVFAIGAVCLLGLNILLATAKFGALNWIEIGPITIQPSEFVKVAFVFAGGATLDRLLTSKNILKFMIFAGVCVGALVIMRDLGAALIFYSGFLVMTFMRSGDFKRLGLVTAVCVAGAVIVASFLPHISNRIDTWRNVWELSDGLGFQQTRTMIYTASGGMVGVGPGQGYLERVSAADTDLVFGMLSEEWGLIVALTCAFAAFSLALFVGMSIKVSRSAFYAIVAGGAATILLVQASLNIFGSLDILPLTGVTLPFVSKGGSSMIACWGLLACIKSVDERHRAQDLE